MKQTILLITGAALLASCSKGPQVNEKNASVEQVAKAVRESGVANDVFLHAGEWRVSGTMEEMTMPGLPPEAQSQMKRIMGQNNSMTYDYCLTPDQAKHPGGKFFSGKAENNCRYDHFTMGGGKIDAVMQCKGEAAGNMTMTIDGTYSPDTYSTHVAMNMQGGREGSMTMKMRSEAHRVGECTAEDRAAAERDSGTKG